MGSKVLQDEIYQASEASPALGDYTPLGAEDLDQVSMFQQHSILHTVIKGSQACQDT